jgi:hypothetical protein
MLRAFMYSWVVDQLGELADEATSRLMDGLDLPAEFEAAAASLLAAWSKGRSWQGFSLDDVDRLRPAFALAKAILENILPKDRWRQQSP